MPQETVDPLAEVEPTISYEDIIASIPNNGLGRSAIIGVNPDASELREADSEQAVNQDAIDKWVSQLKQIPAADLANSFISNQDAIDPSFHKYIAELLINSGDYRIVILVARNLDKFQGLDHVDIARHLIEAGEGYAVAENLDKFQGLNHVDIARQIIETGRGGAVAENLDKFQGLNADIAHQLIEARQTYVVVKNLDKFQGLNADIAHQLIEAGYGGSVAQNLDKFQDLNHIDIARQLIEARQTYVVAENLDKFQGLNHADIARQIIETGRGGAVAENLDKFQGLNHVDIAHQLVETGQGGSVADNLDKFQGLNHADIARQIIETGRGGAVAENLDKFQGLNHVDIAHQLIEARESYVVAENLDKFQGLNADIAHQLIEARESYAVVKNLDKFQGLNADIARQLIEARQTYAVAENFDKFQGLNADIAHQLIEAGYGGSVAQNLDKFQGLNHVDIARQLIEARESYVVAENLDIFQGLNADIAHQLIETEKGDEVVRNLNAFQGLDYTELAKVLVANYYPAQALWLRHQVEGIDFNVLADALMQDYPDLVLGHLFLFPHISDENLQKLSEHAGRKVERFPAGDHRLKQFRWYAQNSYTDLGPGWPEVGLGSVIAQRIEQGMEEDLHDATQWLSGFKIPEGGYSVSAISAQRASGATNATEILDSARRVFISSGQEISFLQRLASLSPEDTEKLSQKLTTKPDKVSRMFHDATGQFVYQSIVELMKDPNGAFSLAPLHERQLVLLHYLEQKYAEYFNNHISGVNRKETSHHYNKEDFLAACRDLVGKLELPEEPTDTYSSLGEGDERIGVLAVKLTEIGIARQEYINDAINWLTRHSINPSADIVKVWSDRPYALADGAHDRIASLLVWHEQVALRKLIEAEGLPEILAGQDIMGEEWREWRESLLQYLSASNTLKAMAKFKKWQSEPEYHEEKLLPADKIELQIETGDQKASQYTFEILAKDDPRGFTIGEETDCCMTIEGASRSCIKAGYSLPNAGFLSLREANGQMVAQSFWYIHPEHPDILVLDNIEANQGRDFQRVTQLYQDALKQYLTELAQNNGVHIKKVHVGTGYTEVNIGHLPSADPVPPLTSVRYSDAEKQKLLLDLS